MSELELFVTPRFRGAMPVTSSSLDGQQARWWCNRDGVLPLPGSIQIQAGKLNPTQLPLSSPMAVAHCTVSSGLTSSYIPSTRRTYPLLLVSSIPTPNPSRIRHRKNYLRPKILKTLNEPFELITPLLPPEPPPESSSLVLSHEDYDDGTRITAEQGDTSEKLLVSETTGEYGGVAVKLSARSILEYGAYLIGVFVFYTICSVWVMSKQKAVDLEINGRGKRNFLINWIGKTKRAANANNEFRKEDQLELEKRIGKIKLMAKEARRIEEKKKEEVGDHEIGHVSADSSRELGIKKEVNAGLANLQNKINSDSDRSAVSHGNKMNSDRVSMNMNQGKGKLMFKKKLRFRSPSSAKPTKAPKGFPGIRDRRAPNSKKRDLARTGTAQEFISAATNRAQILFEDNQVNQQDVETLKSDSKLSLKDGEN